MNVLEKFQWMVRTGYTGVDLILGHRLQDIMLLVTAELISNSRALGYQSIDFSVDYKKYSAPFYHIAWEAYVRPVVAKYLEEKAPTAWYKQYYTLNLKPN